MLAQVDSEQLNLKDSSKRQIRVPQKCTQLNIRWAATCLGLFLWILLSFPSHPQPAYYPIRSQSLVRRIKVTPQHNRLLDSRSVTSDTHWVLNSEHKAWSGLGPLTRVDSTLHSKNRQLGRKSQGPPPWPKYKVASGRACGVRMPNQMWESMKADSLWRPLKEYAERWTQTGKSKVRALLKTRQLFWLPLKFAML